MNTTPAADHGGLLDHLPEWLFTSEVCHALRINRETLRARIKDGSLPAYRIGDNPRRHLRFRRADVEALLQRVEVK